MEKDNIVVRVYPLTKHSVDSVLLSCDKVYIDHLDAHGPKVVHGDGIVDYIVEHEFIYRMDTESDKHLDFMKRLVIQEVEDLLKRLKDGE